MWFSICRNSLRMTAALQVLAKTTVLAGMITAFFSVIYLFVSLHKSAFSTGFYINLCRNQRSPPFQDVFIWLQRYSTRVSLQPDKLGKEGFADHSRNTRQIYVSYIVFRSRKLIKINGITSRFFFGGKCYRKIYL